MKKIIDWIDERFPLLATWKTHFSEYYVPKNLNFFYFFGSLALVVLAIQLITGLWLTMFYVPTAEQAFSSIEYIMRDVNYGWLLRYLHSTGASALFIILYLHMFKGLLYGSYQKPRELIWLLGMILFLLLMAEAFFGYLLPWGQMSYWGAQVITSLFSAIPYIGDTLVTWVRGDYTVANATLQRFFALHVIGIPLLLLFFVFLHLIALHKTGSNNPEGIEIKERLDPCGKPLDGIPLHPYFTVKDFVAVLVFLIVFLAVVFFFPEMGGYFLEHENFAPANPLVTPEHIAPVWYMTPFYSILRAIPDKLAGVIAMAAAILILLAMPWLDKSPVRSMRYKGAYSRYALGAFVICFFILGYLGTVNVTPLKQYLARISTAIYFAYFLFMPMYSRYEAYYEPPMRISKVKTFFLSFFTVLMVSIGQCAAVSLLPIKIDVHDQARLQRGAKFFMNYCAGCHSLRYLRYNQMGKDLGLTTFLGQLDKDLLVNNLIFTTVTMEEPIQISMLAEDARRWFGVVPPDLSLTARERGASWIYTYLKSFYADNSRPFGANNLLVPGVAMPNILAPLEGEVVIAREIVTPHLILKKEGEMSRQQFDNMLEDLISFLVYVGEPAQLIRYRVGAIVIGFLSIFLIFAYLLKRLYWRND